MDSQVQTKSPTSAFKLITSTRKSSENGRSSTLLLKVYDILLEPETAEQYLNTYQQLNKEPSKYLPILLGSGIRNNCLTLTFEHVDELPVKAVIESLRASFKDLVRFSIALAKGLQQIHSHNYCFDGFSFNEILVEADSLNPTLFHLENAKPLAPSKLKGEEYKSIQKEDGIRKHLRNDVQSIGFIIAKILGVGLTSTDLMDWVNVATDLKLKLKLYYGNQTTEEDIGNFLNILYKLLSDFHEDKYRRASDVIGALKSFLLPKDTTGLEPIALQEVSRISDAKKKAVFKAPFNKYEALEVINTQLSHQEDKVSSLTFIKGESGSGKTYLLNHVASTISKHQIVYQCSPDLNFKYKALIGLLDRSIAITIDNSRKKANEFRARLNELLCEGQIPDILLAKMPYLREYLEYKEAPRKTLKEVEVDDLIRLTNLIYDHALSNCILVDDIHFSDYHSVDFLEQWMVDNKDRPFNLVVSVDPEKDIENHNAFDKLYRIDFSNEQIECRSVSLTDLSQNNIKTFIETHLKPTNDINFLSKQIYDCLTEKTPHAFMRLIDLGFSENYIRQADSSHVTWDIEPIIIRYVNDPDSTQDTLSEYINDKDLWAVLSAASCFHDPFTKQQVIQVLLGNRECSDRLFHRITTSLDQLVDGRLLLKSDMHFEFAFESSRQEVFNLLTPKNLSKYCHEIASIYIEINTKESTRIAAEYIVKMGKQWMKFPTASHQRILDALLALFEKHHKQHHLEDACIYLVKSIDFIEISEKEDTVFHTDLKYELCNKLADIYLLMGNIERGIEVTDTVIYGCENTTIKARAYLNKMQLKKSIDLHSEAIALGHVALRLIGRGHSSRWMIPKSIVAYFKSYLIKREFNKTPITSWKVTNSEDLKLYYQICFNMASAAYLTSNISLFFYMLSKPLLVARTEGVSKELIPILAFLGGTAQIILNSSSKKSLTSAPDKMIEQAEALVDSLDARDYGSFIHYFDNAMLKPWYEGTKATETPLVNAYKQSLHDEHIELSGWCSGQYFVHRFFSGEAIDDLKVKMEQTYPSIQRHRPGGPLIIHKIIQQCVTNLVDTVKEPWNIDGPIFKREELKPLDSLDDSLIRSCVIFTSCFLPLIFQKYSVGAHSFSRFRLKNNGMLGLIAIPYLLTYGQICVMSKNHDANTLVRLWTSLKVKVALMTKYRSWAYTDQFSFLRHWLEAERCFLEHKTNAEQLFSEAFEYAATNNNLKEAAIISERLALYSKHVLRDANKTAQYYERALHYYDKSGCFAKTKPVRTELRALTSGTDSSTNEDVFHLLSESVLALNECKSKNQLIKTTAEELINFSQAYHIVVIERVGQNFLVAAAAHKNQPIIEGHLPIERCNYICHSAVSNSIKARRYVYIDSEALRNHSPETQDYFELRNLHSLHCAPIIVDGVVEGVICCEYQSTSLISRQTIESAIGIFTNYVASAINSIKGEFIKRKNNDISGQSVLGLINHEFRTPIYVGISKIDDLDSIIKKSENEELKASVSVIRKQLNKLNNYVTDITDLAAIQNKAFSLSRHYLNVGEAIKSAIDINLESASQKNIEIDSQLAPSPILIGDQLRFSQVLNILISNAIKFTPGKEDKNHITVISQWIKLNDDKGEISVSVCDQGIGIDKDYQNQMFLPFDQQDKRLTREYEGLGLGLSLANELVNLMGGEIDIDSEVNVGSRFKVTAPFDIAPKDAQDQFSKLNELQKSEPTQEDDSLPKDVMDVLRTLNVLIVDDNHEVLESTSGILKKLGIEYDCVTSGEEAIESLKAKSYSLVLLDVHMQGISGLEVAKKVRSMSNIDPIIIAVSADDSTEQQCLEAGMDSFLQKPVTTNKLLLQICDELGLSIEAKVQEDTNETWSPKIMLRDVSGPSIACYTISATIHGYLNLEENFRRYMASGHQQDAFLLMHQFKNLAGVIRAYNLMEHASELENVKELNEENINDFFVKLSADMNQIDRSFIAWLKELTTPNERNDAELLLNTIKNETIELATLKELQVKWPDGFIGDLLSRLLETIKTIEDASLEKLLNQLKMILEKLSA